MTDDDNAARAERAAAVLAFYAERWEGRDEDETTTLTDLLADMHHLQHQQTEAVASGDDDDLGILDVERAYDMSLLHFQEEAPQWEEEEEGEEEE